MQYTLTSVTPAIHLLPHAWSLRLNARARAFYICPLRLRLKFSGGPLRELQSSLLPQNFRCQLRLLVITEVLSLDLFGLGRIESPEATSLVCVTGLIEAGLGSQCLERRIRVSCNGGEIPPFPGTTLFLLLLSLSALCLLDLGLLPADKVHVSLGNTLCNVAPSAARL